MDVQTLKEEVMNGKLISKEEAMHFLIRIPY